MTTGLNLKDMIALERLQQRLNNRVEVKCIEILFAISVHPVGLSYRIVEVSSLAIRYISLNATNKVGEAANSVMILNSGN